MARRRKQFTENEVRAIRQLIMRGERTRREIAEDFNVSTETINRIARRENFKWVIDDPLPAEQIPQETLSEADESIRKLKEMGVL